MNEKHRNISWLVVCALLLVGVPWFLSIPAVGKIEMFKDSLQAMHDLTVSIQKLYDLSQRPFGVAALIWMLSMISAPFVLWWAYKKKPSKAPDTQPDH